MVIKDWRKHDLGQGVLQTLPQRCGRLRRCAASARCRCHFPPPRDRDRRPEEPSPERRERSLSLLCVVDRLDEFRHGSVGRLDLAVDELRHDVLVGVLAMAGGCAVTLRQRTEQRALVVGSLEVGDALLAAGVEVGVRTRRYGREPNP